jgi:hypothetical protein
MATKAKTNGKAKRAQPKRRSHAAKAVDLTLINLKATERDRALLISRAKRFAKGNLSAWLRHAGIHHKPSGGRI